ncbi:carbon-nitrogen hydrolase family protein [Adhaeribacter arboris]|uniref:Carbon-nitrogen hydrolase family protein n=1 Tax=Adhaeribacter arboris TaxID=2072846 RepID=A0A2T2YLR0_9BACT|nr:carbon-nitrogen hydrolase family protein [Adhaeribacter arboris]PSR56448.1 carbon-nitrogen hydrolase family protein [Adhaeribacter arboris]
MRIGVAQTRPIKGDIPKNIENHKKLIDQALSLDADLIIFPELSLTGYEPELARKLATKPDDNRLNDFQAISDTHQIIIGIGLPIKNAAGVHIGLVLFHPHQAPQTYAKQFLHPDEESFFVCGPNSPGLIENHSHIAMAICYEISVPEHAETAFKQGAGVYLTSVAKSVQGLDRALPRLAGIAKTYSMQVFMSNCVGPAGGMECGGKTSVWNKQGLLMGQRNDTDEGILVFDTNTQELISAT